MQVKHSNRSVSASFDDPNLVSSAGLVPMMVLAAKTGLGALVDEWVKLPGYFGANAGLKVTALVAGMLTGADSIDLCRLCRQVVASSREGAGVVGLLGRWPWLRVGIFTGLRGRRAACRPAGNGQVATGSGWSGQELVL